MRVSSGTGARIRRYSFNGKFGACVSEADFDEMQSNISHRDKEALNDMQRRRVCVFINQGTKATIINAGLTYAKVRVYGKHGSAVLWTSWDGLDSEDVAVGQGE